MRSLMRVARLLCLGAGFAVLVPAATKIITVNTSPLIGHPAGPFSLAFQLTDGSGAGDANNTVTVTGFQFGGGNATGSPAFAGGASGSLTSSVTLTDSAFVNFLVQPFVPGSRLTFVVSVTANLESGEIPDRFGFAILDSGGAEIPTLAGEKVDQLVAVAIDSPDLIFETFASDPIRTPLTGGSAIVMSEPSAGSDLTLFPTSGTGSSGLFTFNFSDPDGFADLNILNVLINNALDGRNGCYIAFVRPTGTLYLVNDAGDAGGPFAGSITIPGSGTVSNSQCTINATGSAVSGAGNNVSLSLNMSFTAGFGGRRIMHLAARDIAQHNSGWHARGVWTVPFAQPATAVISMSPQRTDGKTVTLTTVFSDVNGFADLNVLNMLINNGIDGRNACYIAYVRPSRTLLLVNDAGDAGGPFVGSIPIPGTGIASNSQCGINATGSSITESGNTVTLTLNFSFTGAFQGDRIVYAAARDVAENNSGWQAMGTITVPVP